MDIELKERKARKGKEKKPHLLSGRQRFVLKWDKESPTLYTWTGDFIFTIIGPEGHDGYPSLKEPNDKAIRKITFPLIRVVRERLRHIHYELSDKLQEDLSEECLEVKLGGPIEFLPNGRIQDNGASKSIHDVTIELRSARKTLYAFSDHDPEKKGLEISDQEPDTSIARVQSKEPPRGAPKGFYITMMETGKYEVLGFDEFLEKDAALAALEPPGLVSDNEESESDSESDSQSEDDDLPEIVEDDGL